MNEAELRACRRYVEDLFAPEDEVLRQLREEMAEAAIPEIHISAEQGRLIQLLLTAIGARRVVELGTLAGYSAIWIARALPEDGQLITIELDPVRAELARRFIARAGLENRVEVWVGEALELLGRVEGTVDAVFIDADKPTYPVYLDWCLTKVRSGGMVIADNAFQGGRVVERDSGDPDVVAIREFNQRLAEDPRLLSIVTPLRDGVAIALVDRG